ncbi:MAG TPA: pentapeptide repeat-containing protein, partial [Kofleriaceae bacterium]|nr:pentapeptide repeat-containing protein [Kofleriaceae bacterium]
MTRPDKQWKSDWDLLLSPRLKAHWRWCDHQGRTGDGRIEMSDANLRGARVRGLEGARFERCDFSGAAVHLWQGAELVDCTFDEAIMSVASWEHARITN